MSNSTQSNDGADRLFTTEENYGYTPSTNWCTIFIALFAATAIIHSIQAGRSKYWIIYPTLVLGALVELLGWGGRLVNSINTTVALPFLIQICCLIIAPVFFSAYNYAVLGSAIHHLGSEYSFLRPKWYLIIFIIADIVSLVIQAVGGGSAASASSNGTSTDTATDIMVAGIIFQMVTMAIFIACGIDFCIRVNSNKPYKFQVQKHEKTGVISAAEGGGRQKSMAKWWIMMFGVGISSIMIFIRGVFRSIELSQGWASHLATTEIYQCVLDGIPMVIAVAIFNFINPLYVMPKKERWVGYY